MRKLIVALALGGIALMPTASRAGTLSPATEELLQSSSYIYVATQRKDGTLGSFSPIWFMYDKAKGQIFFTTSPDSWKAKRIAKGSPVTVRVGTEDGPTLVGPAEKVTDVAYIDQIGKLYDSKYWISWLGFFRPRGERVQEGKTMAYLVTPTEQ